jgi:hypothetical protein
MFSLDNYLYQGHYRGFDLSRKIDNPNVIDLSSDDYIKFLFYLQDIYTKADIEFRITHVIAINPDTEVQYDSVEEGFEEHEELTLLYVVEFTHPKLFRKTNFHIEIKKVSNFDRNNKELVLNDFIKYEEEYLFNTYNTEFKLYFNEKKDRVCLGVKKMFINLEFKN